jgi:hypothetical protein
LAANIIFHIGLEKTGTTSFQRFCTDRRAQLLSHGILYPTRNSGFFKTSHEPLAACYFPDGAARELAMRSSNRDRASVVRSLIGEIEGASVDTALVSAEHFSSRFDAKRIDALAADFSRYDCRIAIVLRDHAARALSAYSTAILSGRYLTLQDYVDEICGPANIYIRYRETISQWEDVFGRANIRLIAYRRDDNMVGVLARALISPEMHAPRAGDYFEKKSPGAAAIEARRRINQDSYVRRCEGASAFDLKSLLARARHATAQRTIEDSSDRLRFNADQLGRIEAIAQGDRQWLAEHYDFTLDEQGAETR